MKRVFYFIAAASFLFAGCSGFKKTKEGLLYKIVSDGTGTKLAYGNYFEVAINIVYKGTERDSVLNSSKDFGDQVAQLDSLAIPPLFFQIFEQARVGDSIITKEPTDSIMKGGQQLPPFIKRGNFIVSTYKVVKIFTTREEADSATKANRLIAKATSYQKTIVEVEKQLSENAAQMQVDDKLINDYMAAHKITNATKTAWGTYVAIDSPGTGDNIGKGDYVEINYTGKTFNDTTFDSNTDPKFSHTDPIDIDMSLFSVIPGWIDGLHQMKKGSKGKLIIPSTLGYGKNGGGGGKIPPNANLVFDIQVVDVLNQQQYEEKQKAEQQKMMMQRMMQQQKEQAQDSSKH